jgi:hypothetical protein
MQICAKTSYVGWSSTESRRISYFHSFLSYNHYFRKYFKSVYNNVVMVTLPTGIKLFLFTCVHFLVWGILRKRSACAPTAYEVVSDYGTFEKHLSYRYACLFTNHWGTSFRIIYIYHLQSFVVRVVNGHIMSVKVHIYIYIYLFIYLFIYYLVGVKYVIFS